MDAVIQEDAHVLVPNKDHKNFTRSNEIIPKGTKVKGEHKIIKGLYRGNPFEYNLFYTNDNKIIYIKHIKPNNMNKTEVTLGADSQQSATKIELPTNSNLGQRTVIITVAAALAGFGFAKYKKIEGKKVLLYTVIGAALGFVAGKYLQSHRDIKVLKSK